MCGDTDCKNGCISTSGPLADKSPLQMQQDFYNKLVGIVKELEATFKTRFIVTGSFAMVKIGLQDMDKVKDLDLIIVQPTADQIAIFKAYEVAMKPTTRDEYHIGQRNDWFRFVYKGVDIDVFVEHDYPKFLLCTDGLMINTVKRIIAAKRRMGRKKDLEQLQQYAVKFLQA